MKLLFFECVYMHILFFFVVLFLVSFVLFLMLGVDVHKCAHAALSPTATLVSPSTLILFEIASFFSIPSFPTLSTFFFSMPVRPVVINEGDDDPSFHTLTDHLPVASTTLILVLQPA